MLILRLKLLLSSMCDVLYKAPDENEKYDRICDQADDAQSQNVDEC